MTNPVEVLRYPIIEPFKLRRVVVKPPGFVQLSREEALPFIEVGVIGDVEQAAPAPDSEAEAERLAAEQAAAGQAAKDAAEAQRLAEEQAAADQAAKDAAEAQRLADEKTAADAKAAEDAKKAAPVATATSKPATTRRGARNPNA